MTTNKQEFWNNRWIEQQTGWDIGYASPAITKYMEDFPNKNARIIIPGCGNAYEAEYLVRIGFTDITLVDISPKLVESLQLKYKDTPQIQVICEDFFQHQGTYDLLIEQTFFCAIDPSLRKQYVQKAHELLAENGRIIGVLFNTVFEKQGPPFGGTTTEYHPIFDPYFEIQKMEPCYNSIPPRAGSEVFVNFLKK